MKRILFFFFSILYVSTFAQNPLPRTKLPSQYITFDVSGESNMPSNKYLGYLFAYDPGTQTLIWYAKTSPELIILQQKFKPALFKFDNKLFSRCEYLDGKIYLCSSVPNKGEEICGVFSWENFKIEFEKETRFDPNPILLKKADSLLIAKQFVASAQTLKKITFFSAYANPNLKGAELFKASFDYAVNTFISVNKFKNALEFMKQVMPTVDSLLFSNLKTADDLTKTFGKKLGGMTKDECEKALLNYCEWYIKTRDYNGFLAIHEKYMKLSPQNPQWYLLRGDAYYGKAEKVKAKDNYIIYKDKMTAMKKDKDIPIHVIQRSK